MDFQGAAAKKNKVAALEANFGGQGISRERFQTSGEGDRVSPGKLVTLLRSPLDTRNRGNGLHTADLRLGAYIPHLFFKRITHHLIESLNTNRTILPDNCRTEVVNL